MTQFKFSGRHPARQRRAETTTFTIDRLWTDENGSEREISHLLDRSYRYQSMRELKWHLAERFGLPVGGIALHRA